MMSPCAAAEQSMNTTAHVLISALLPRIRRLRRPIAEKEKFSTAAHRRLDVAALAAQFKFKALLLSDTGVVGRGRLEVSNATRTTCSNRTT